MINSIVHAFLTLTLFSLCVVGEIYEIRNEDDGDRKKKLWLFNHGLY